MFHIAGIQLVAPFALLNAIAQVEAVGAEVHVSSADNRVVAIAAAAVGRQSSLEIVLCADDIFGQRIDQVLWFD